MLKGIFFCDVDGTLIPPGETRPTESLLDLMREAPKKGYLFCITSGRMYHSIKAAFAPVEDCALFSTSNGGSVFASGKPLPGSLFVPRVHALEVGRLASLRGRTVLYSSQDCLYETGVVSPFLDSLMAMQGSHPIAIASPDDLSADPDQLTVVAEDHYEEELAFFKKSFQGILNVAKSGEFLIDVSPADKSRTVRNVCEYYHLPISDSYAFGDTENDLPMLRAAGTGYVMESGSENVKREFPHHTSDLEKTIRNLMER